MWRVDGQFIDDMANSPEVDLVVVCVRVPWHYDLVMAGLRANKPVFCEWPLGANLKEAEEMHGLAQERGLATMVGLQARSDPTLQYARELVQQGYIGEVLAANLSVITGAQIVRGPGRTKTVFGTNFPTVGHRHALTQLASLDLTPETRDGLLGGTARRIFTRLP